jgi:predicted lipid-binding transport protein (Tim44 family)
MVAGIILFRLYTVLGRRTGNEREPQERLRQIGAAPPAAPAPADNVVAVPDRSAAPKDWQIPSGDPVAKSLLDIKLADRSFEAEHFLEGARHAYQMIVTAFAERDRESLRPLVSEEVYSAFDSVMRGHEERHETVKYTFEGFRSVRIAHAELKARTAEGTVEFAARFVSTTVDISGAVIEGDAESIREVVDIWTFARDTRSNDPNWTLVATSGES